MKWISIISSLILMLTLTLQTVNAEDHVEAATVKGKSVAVCNSGGSSGDDLPALDADIDLLVGTTEEYGTPFTDTKAETVELNFTTPDSKPTNANHLSLSVRRDLMVSFTTKHADSDFPRGKQNRTNVKLNGSIVHRTSYSSSSNEIKHQIYLSRNRLKRGGNTLVLSPQRLGNDRPWGVKDFRVEYVPRIELGVGVLDTGRYGSDQQVSRYTGFRVDFAASKPLAGYVLELVGNSIADSDELEVLVNGNSIGFVRRGGNGIDSQKDVFRIPSSVLKEGRNQIEFFQKYIGGGSWGVSKLRVIDAGADLTVNQLKITSSAVEENKPFSVVATVKNVGSNRSKSGCLSFFVSNDKTIDSSDQRIKSSTLEQVASGRMLEVTGTLTTEKVGSKYYLGACIENVLNDRSVGNNCSTGIKVRAGGNVNIAPITSLLLDD